MDRNEVKKILMVMEVSFPSYKVKNEYLSETIDVWLNVLGDYSYQDVSNALKSFIVQDTSGFAPSIGQIVDKIHTLKRPVDDLTEQTAWALVSKALRNSSYRAREEFDKLPDLIQKTLGSPSQLECWAKDEYYNESVVSSNFMRAFRIVQQREQDYQKLPQPIKDRLTGGMNIGIGTEEVTD